jgi:hypothetical protein
MATTPRDQDPLPPSAMDDFAERESRVVAANHEEPQQPTISPRSIFEKVAAFFYYLREWNAPLSAFFLAVLFPLDIAFSVVGQIGRLYLDPTLRTTQYLRNPQNDFNYFPRAVGWNITERCMFAVYTIFCFLWMYSNISAKTRLKSAIKRICAPLSGLILLGLFRILAMQIWGRIAWNNELCLGWDYLITLHSISHPQLHWQGSEYKILSNATILGGNGTGFSLELNHPSIGVDMLSARWMDSNISGPYGEFRWSLTQEVFNYSDYSPASANGSGSFITGATLPFSGNFTTGVTLSFGEMSVVYDFYDSVTWDYGPAMRVVDSNGSDILRTKVTNYNDCTTLKACGNGDPDLLSVLTGILLGVLEPFALYCSNEFQK